MSLSEAHPCGAQLGWFVRSVGRCRQGTLDCSVSCDDGQGFLVFVATCRPSGRELYVWWALGSLRQHTLVSAAGDTSQDSGSSGRWYCIRLDGTAC